MADELTPLRAAVAGVDALPSPAQGRTWIENRWDAPRRRRRNQTFWGMFLFAAATLGLAAVATVSRSRTISGIDSTTPFTLRASVPVRTDDLGFEEVERIRADHEYHQSLAEAELVGSEDMEGDRWFSVSSASAISTNSETDKGNPGDADKPHVIYIMIDDMGWNDMGYQSSDLHAMTPFMDSMANQGIKLTNYYSMYLCSPARASLLTGRYVFRYGMQYNVVQPTAPWGLPLGEKLMPEYFKDAGYATHMVGKWHLGMYLEDYLPHRRGFDTFLGYLNDEEDYWTHQSYSVLDRGKKFYDFGYGDKDGYINETTHIPRHGPDYIGKYSTTVFTDRAIKIVEKHAEENDTQPLFLYFASQAVHTPINPPDLSVFNEEQLKAIDDITTDRLIRKEFARVLLYLDMSVERLVKSLEATGLMDNAIIIVTSDNGGCRMYGGSNFPLRGIKHTYWEGGNKVPGFVYSPALLPRHVWGTAYDRLMHVTDWLPTLSSLAGYYVDKSYVDGKDHWGSLSGNPVKAPRFMLVYNSDPYQTKNHLRLTLPPKGAMRVGRWKLIVQEWCSGYWSFSVDDLFDPNACGDLHACWDCGTGCFNELSYLPGNYLFDLESDPHEQINMIDTMPLVARHIYVLWMNETEDYTASRARGGMNDVAENIWSHHESWMVPWWAIFMTHNSTDTPDRHGQSTASRRYDDEATPSPTSPYLLATHTSSQR